MPQVFQVFKNLHVLISELGCRYLLRSDVHSLRLFDYICYYCRFLMQRAEQFIVMRRKPVEVPSTLHYNAFSL